MSTKAGTSATIAASVVGRDQLVKRVRFEELEQVESILEFLVECTQGPCVGNQEFLASTNVIEDCKRLLTSRVYVRQHPRYYYYYLFTNANNTLRTGTSSTATRSTTSRACATRRVL